MDNQDLQEKRRMRFTFTAFWLDREGAERVSKLVSRYFELRSRCPAKRGRFVFIPSSRM